MQLNGKKPEAIYIPLTIEQLQECLKEEYDWQIITNNNFLHGSLLGIKLTYTQWSWKFPVIVQPYLVQGYNVFTDATKDNRATMYIPSLDILHVYETQFTPTQQNELNAILEACRVPHPINIVTDGQYAGGLIQRLEESTIRPSESNIIHLLPRTARGDKEQRVPIVLHTHQIPLRSPRSIG